MTTLQTTKEVKAGAKELLTELKKVADFWEGYVADFRKYVTGLEEFVKGKDNDVRYLTTAAFARRTMEELDHVNHLHTGSTHAMHSRHVQQSLFELLAGEVDMY